MFTIDIEADMFMFKKLLLKAGKWVLEGIRLIGNGVAREVTDIDMGS